MPTYTWSCLACGASNLASAMECGACQCPAAATAVQAELSFSMYLASGHVASSRRGAGELVPELSAAQVFGPPVLLLLGLAPTGWSAWRREQILVWLLVGLCGALMVFSYGVQQWGWWPSGRGAPSLVRAVVLGGPIALLLVVIGLALVRARRSQTPAGERINVV